MLVVHALTADSRCTCLAVTSCNLLNPGCAHAMAIKGPTMALLGLLGLYGGPTYQSSQPNKNEKRFPSVC